MLNNLMIQVKGVSFRYRGASVPALADFNLRVLRGSWVTVIGTNGSGKSTLVKVIDGLLIPQQGAVQIAGHWLTARNVRQLRTKIGVVFQNPADQFVNATVADDLAFGLENYRVPTQRMDLVINHALQLVGIRSLKYVLLHHLSGGQKQRVALAEILAVRPQILILDESTSMLNPLSRLRILHLIIKLKRRFHLTVIEITHSASVVKYADQVVVMNRGRRVMVGTPRQVFNRPLVLERAGLVLPPIDQLRRLLIQSGLPLPKTYLSETEVLDCLQKWF